MQLDSLTSAAYQIFLIVKHSWLRVTLSRFPEGDLWVVSKMWTGASLALYLRRLSTRWAGVSSARRTTWPNRDLRVETIVDMGSRPVWDYSYFRVLLNTENIFRFKVEPVPQRGEWVNTQVRDRSLRLCYQRWRPLPKYYLGRYARWTGLTRTLKKSGQHRQWSSLEKDRRASGSGGVRNRGGRKINCQHPSTEAWKGFSTKLRCPFPRQHSYRVHLGSPVKTIWTYCRDREDHPTFIYIWFSKDTIAGDVTDSNDVLWLVDSFVFGQVKV